MPDDQMIEEKEPRQAAICAVEGCDRSVRSRGMCINHYQVWYKANPELVRRYGPRDETPFERVKRHTVVNPETGCWEKHGWVNNAGYGQVRIGKKFYLMHRLAWEGVNGPIPAGLTIDHLCRNRCCSNPDHLEAVTHRENLMRSPTQITAVHARKTHCIRGHEFTPENTKIRASKNGAPGRVCIACEKQKGRKVA